MVGIIRCSRLKLHLTFIFHEIIGKLLDIGRSVMMFDKFVVMEVRDDDVFGVASHVHHLNGDQFKFIFIERNV